MDKFTAIWQEADEEKRKEIRQMIRNQPCEHAVYNIYTDVVHEGSQAFRYALLYGLLRGHFEDYYYFTAAIKSNTPDEELQKVLVDVIAKYKDEILGEADNFDLKSYKYYSVDNLKYILQQDTTNHFKQLLVDNDLPGFVNEMSQFIYDSFRLLLISANKTFPFAAPFIEAVAVVLAEYYECRLIKPDSFNECVAFLTNVACTLVENYDKNVIYNIFHAHDSDLEFKESPGIVLIQRPIDVREKRNYYKVVACENVKERMSVIDMKHVRVVYVMYVQDNLKRVENTVMTAFKKAFKAVDSKNKCKLGLFIIDDENSAYNVLRSLD